MTTQEELIKLYEQLNNDSLSMDQALEIQWQIDFLEQCRSVELEDFDIA